MHLWLVATAFTLCFLAESSFGSRTDLRNFSHRRSLHRAKPFYSLCAGHFGRLGNVRIEAPKVVRTELKGARFLMDQPPDIRELGRVVWRAFVECQMVKVRPVESLLLL